MSTNSISNPNPHWAVALAGLVDGDAGIRSAIAQMESRALREFAGEIACCEDLFLPLVLDSLGLPQLDRPHFWLDGVLPRIREELARRDRKLRNWAFDQNANQEKRTSKKGARKTPDWSVTG